MTSAPAPIVIGALGGSGTRVPAQALIEAGVFLGSELNQARDNLVFTAMFRRPRWYARASEAQVHRQLDTFARYMRGQRYRPADYARLARSAVDHDPQQGLRRSARTLLAAARRRGVEAAGAWGWKEPNSHVFLPHLADHFPGLRFVYVVRHGLDMAFSRNQTQLELWGPKFGVTSQVDYWIAATRRALDIGSELLGDRFLFLRFDDLCADPAAELERLLDFAGVAHDRALVERLAPGVETPASVGRWRQHAAAFTAEQLAAVASFGFDVTA